MEYVAEKEIKDYQFCGQGTGSPSTKEELTQEQQQQKKHEENWHWEPNQGVQFG